jgi:hypothetical protein
MGKLKAHVYLGRVKRTDIDDYVHWSPRVVSFRVEYSHIGRSLKETNSKATVLFRPPERRGSDDSEAVS